MPIYLGPVGATAFSSAVKPNGCAVILGDISGSMRQGNRMACLKKSFRTIISTRVRSQQPVALAGWDAWTQWCSNPHNVNARKISEDSRNRAERADWITKPGDEEWALQWVENLRVRGGNNMRYAIEDTMRKFPDATDVYIMCDGDVAPFAVRTQGTRSHVCTADTSHVHQDIPRPLYCSDEAKRTTVDWQLFLERPLFQNVQFHFIALGKGADMQTMQNMAAIGAADFIDVQE